MKFISNKLVYKSTYLTIFVPLSKSKRKNQKIQTFMCVCRRDISIRRPTSAWNHPFCCQRLATERWLAFLSTSATSFTTLFQTFSFNMVAQNMITCHGVPPLHPHSPRRLWHLGTADTRTPNHSCCSLPL